ncbi:MAG: hypothetical protein R3E10_04000 [Gemmatimonadota bacterium]
MKRTLSGLALLLALHGPLAGQSLFGSGGLGLPLEALDARARALGVVGPGLLGGSMVPNDPASAATIALPTLMATMQPTWGRYEEGSLAGDLQGVRFPMLAVGYPIGPWGNLTATYQGVFDQRWAAERTTTVDVGGESVAAEDRFESQGGVALFQVGWGRRIGERVGVGAAFGRYTGRLDRAFTRTLDSLSVGNDVATFTEVAAWSYSGTAGSVGVQFDPVPIVRLGAAVGWSGSLKADPKPGFDAEGATFDLPLEYRFGASAALTRRLMVTGGFRYADWAGADAGIPGIETTGAVTALGLGMEWGGPRFIGRTLPIRLGYRRAGLPYRYGEGDPVESSLSAGLSLNLAQVEEFTLAGIDLALERGTRSDDTLSERFWRMTVSLRVSGR